MRRFSPTAASGTGRARRARGRGPCCASFSAGVALRCPRPASASCRRSAARGPTPPSGSSTCRRRSCRAARPARRAAPRSRRRTAPAPCRRTTSMPFDLEAAPRPVDRRRPRPAARAPRPSRCRSTGVPRYASITCSVGLHLLGRALAEHGAGVEAVDPVRQAHDERHVVLDHQDRRPGLLLDRPQQRRRAPRSPSG